MQDIKITIEKLCGTPREVADRARTTIGLGEGTKDVSEAYMRKMYLCEHSPSRTEMYKIKFENIPYWIAMHLCRHKVGVEHFVSTQRTDRTGKSERGSQDAPVLYEMVLNAQALINISRRRCCMCASTETRQLWNGVIDTLREINPALAKCCVKECVYRSHCFEYKSCGYHLTSYFKKEVNSYREGINEWKNGEV